VGNYLGPLLVSTILGRCGLRPSLRLVSDRVASWEWESIPRREQSPRYRQRGLAPWRPKLIEAKAREYRVPITKERKLTSDDQQG